MVFQFDRYGGGFVIEVAVCSPDGYSPHWRRKVLLNKVTVYDLHPDNRLRLKEKQGQWFRYATKDKSEDIFENIANEVLKHLEEAEDYWGNN